MPPARSSALATSVETHSLRVLADFADREELLRAVRASASLPRLGGELPSFRGERMADTGLIEPIPSETAYRDGATRVLVLRSRHLATVSRRSALSASPWGSGMPQVWSSSCGPGARSTDLAREGMRRHIGTAAPSITQVTINHPGEQRSKPFPFGTTGVMIARPVLQTQAIQAERFQMADAQMIEQLEAEESMFVQTAQGITSDGTTLTLREVTPSTLYFSDRPQRIVGHMATTDFVDLWGEGDNSFEEDPPNAVLAFLEPSDQVPDDAVVAIKQPRLQDGQLSYAIETLEGTVPTHAGPVTLFIDPFGRPLSPVSVCGVRRRERRRARRRF